MLRITKNRFYVVPVLMRTLDILEFIRRSKTPLKMHDISTGTGVASTTTYRILRTLVHRGYLVQDIEGRFSALNRPELKVNSPQQNNPGKHLQPHTTDLSGDQVIQILGSVLQTLKDGNNATLSPDIAAKSFSPPSKNLKRTIHHRV
jgi:hypothetical protein